jgi:hypothetical protein
MKAEKCGGILPLEILKTWDTEGAWFLVPKYFQWQSPSSIMFHNWLAQHPVTTAYPVIYCCIVMSYDFIYFFAEEIMPTSWLYRWCVLKPPYFQGASWNEVRTRKVLGSLSQILGACSLMILHDFALSSHPAIQRRCWGSRAPAHQTQGSWQGAACGDASVPGCLRVGGWTPGPALRGFTRASPGACWIGAPNIEEWFSSKEFGRVLTCEVFRSNSHFPMFLSRGWRYVFGRLKLGKEGVFIRLNFIFVGEICKKLLLEFFRKIQDSE